MRFFTKQGRALLLAAALAVGAVCIWGCGGGENPGGNSGNHSGSSGAATSGPSVNYGGRTYQTIIAGGQTYRIVAIGGKTGRDVKTNLKDCRCYKE
jgi:hypothetical protein